MMLAAPDAPPPATPQVPVVPNRSIVRDVTVSVLTAVLTALILERVLRRRR